jgi:methionine aminopeptidase
MVKIDFGVHVDGYIAMAAHTIVVGNEAGTPITGPKADVVNAAYTAAEVAARLIAVGGTNKEVRRRRWWWLYLTEHIRANTCLLSIYGHKLTPYEYMCLCAGVCGHEARG